LGILSQFQKRVSWPPTQNIRQYLETLLFFTTWGCNW
jgi:hypothetical protein